MKFLANKGYRIILLFIGLTSLACSSIWAVDFYVNQDGTPHLYNAYLILEILKGNDSIQQFASLNPNMIPNLTGHWLIVFFLVFFAPATTTKIMVTLTFGAFVASLGWLRFQVAGREGLGTALLLGTVLAFNWLWFLGFYNHILAAASFSFSLGLWWRWREGMNLRRALILFLLLSFTFLSHLVSFGLLIAGILVLLLINIRTISRKSTLWTLGALAATVPLVINYFLVSQAEGGIDPQWHYLKNPLSISDWLFHLVTADPFLLISRKAAPFIASTTPAFAAFSSSLWLVIALLLLTWGTCYCKAKSVNRRKGMNGWVILAIILISVWAAGPDDFGKAHGGFLRERTLVLGLVCLVPFFQIGRNRFITSGTQFCLILVILFQTLVLWEYAGQSDRIGKQFLAAKDHIGKNESLGSIVFIGDSGRFRPLPLTNLTSYIGIGKEGPVWDNYEFGYYLFPVVAKTPEERKFVFDFREANTFDLNNPNENIAEKRAKLEIVLALNHDRIAILLVWNEQPDFVRLRENWFEKEAYFESGDLKLFRHR